MEPFVNITCSIKVAALTGAGISAESGVPTFRDKGGIWEKYDVMAVATPQAFQKDPRLVWRFYNERRKQARHVEPNPAHYALARLERLLPEGDFSLITQNVDHLHRQAGSKNVYHMHGELSKTRCTRCQTVRESPEELSELPRCPCGGLLRPHIVWFGEVPFETDTLYQIVGECDLFLVVGTSGVVHPAAGFVIHAKRSGAVTVGVNLEVPDNRLYIDHFYKGKAGEILPRLVDHWANCLGAS
jgi:NAD-dependent deacetylase